jgi:hypothetical protein
MAPRKPSRSVTRLRCVVCDARFAARRCDARYCSGKCRQQATRSRKASASGLSLTELRRAYWAAVRREAQARGVTQSQIVTEQAHFVDEAGNVFMGGSMHGLGPDAQLVGKSTPLRPGWACWGLEAAGPPFSPPTDWFAACEGCGDDSSPVRPLVGDGRDDVLVCGTCQKAAS